MVRRSELFPSLPSKLPTLKVWEVARSLLARGAVDDLSQAVDAIFSSCSSFFHIEESSAFVPKIGLHEPSSASGVVSHKNIY